MTNEDNFILVSLNDEKSKSIAEVIGSKTCKKIINYLTETKEASQKDLSTALKIPLNTIEYNIKKLLDSGFIQKAKNFFWSKKGKKIIMYKLSKKSVIISHKKSNIKKFKSILPAFILTAAGTFAVWIYEKIRFIPQTLNQKYLPVIDESLREVTNFLESPASGANVISNMPLWIWFLAGSLIAITIISIVNWRKL
jgi:DeoR/GlpR family transcriptional regulator of sugar metabolism